jgi:hypothetical protein
MNDNKVQACDAVGEFNAANAAAASPNLAFTTGHVDAVGAADGRRFFHLTAAAISVLAERERQVRVEGWTAEHDDKYSHGQLGLAASCYAEEGPRPYGHDYPTCPGRWPWSANYWKPKDYRSNLVRAGALILAEIERLDRAAAKDGSTP